jgi:hypothetical protein
MQQGFEGRFFGVLRFDFVFGFHVVSPFALR